MPVATAPERWCASLKSAPTSYLASVLSDKGAIYTAARAAHTGMEIELATPRDHLQAWQA